MSILPAARACPYLAPGETAHLETLRAYVADFRESYIRTPDDGLAGSGSGSGLGVKACKRTPACGLCAEGICQGARQLFSTMCLPSTKASAPSICTPSIIKRSCYGYHGQPASMTYLHGHQLGGLWRGFLCSHVHTSSGLVLGLRCCVPAEAVLE